MRHRARIGLWVMIVLIGLAGCSSKPEGGPTIDARNWPTTRLPQSPREAPAAPQ